MRKYRELLPGGKKFNAQALKCTYITLYSTKPHQT
jgi:hypothetical protein